MDNHLNNQFNSVDRVLLDIILKRIYDKNQEHKNNNVQDYKDKPVTSINNVYTVLTTLPLLTSLPIDKPRDNAKYKLDMQLIQTLTNLVSMYKVSSNPCILNELELVLEEYINTLYHCDQ